MSKEKNERKLHWLHIVVFIFTVVICIASLVYNIYLYKHLTGVTERLNSVITENELIRANLDETRKKLEITSDELDATNKSLSNALEENARQSEEIEEYKNYIEDDEAKWRRRYEEYDIATEAWIAMKAQGWSDIVCAGIMGNLMAETGGSGTLYLDWDSNGVNGYGLVQWTSGRRNTIKNRYGTYPSVKEQVQFIHDELYGVNGVRRQVTDSQFDAIMNAETPEECAYAFACYYERCANFARSMRRGYARKAYEYFVEV